MRNVVQSPQSTCHLGNNREVVDASGAVTQVTNYYPFGAPYADASASKGVDVQPYKYNGKELDLMHGLNTYDYGARQHDPILARWDRIDPLCEKYYSTSPYAYCANNPVICVDPDGRKIYVANKNKNSQEKSAQTEFLNFINKITNGSYAFNENGFLYNASKDRNRKSNKIGELIDFAIKEETMIDISFGDEIPDGKGNRVSTDDYCGGATSPTTLIEGKEGKIQEKFYIVIDDTYKMREGHLKDKKGNSLSTDWTDTFIHELFGHGIPRLKKQNGDAIDFENFIRLLIGREERDYDRNQDGTKKEHPAL